MSDDLTNKPVVGDRMAEVAAMGKIAEAVKGLDPDAVARVLRWAAESYGVALGSAPKGKTTGSTTVAENGNGNGTPQFSELGDLFTAASPTTDADKALVVGYWSQFQQGQADFSAFEVNAALKNLGEGVGNITTAFNTLKARKPADVIQLKKSGTSKQARKTYKVTLHGKSAVEAMLGQQS